MLRNWSLYLSLLLLTHCSHRKRDDPQPELPKDPLSLLPPETAEGRGTMACLVNGQAYWALFSTSANGDLQSPSRLALGGNLVLNGQRAAAQLSLIAALNGELQNGQTFAPVSRATPFPLFTPGRDQFITAATGDLACYYSGNFIKTGRVELVKFDGVRRIAAGRFAFMLYEPGGCDTLRVTNGRFDVKF